MIKFEAYFDGAFGPVNPGGTASYGAVIYRKEKRIWQCSETYEPPKDRQHETTNNVAEYAGLLAILNYFLDRRMADPEITIYGDSQLVIQQCFGSWKIKNQGRLYEALALEVKKKLRHFDNISGIWIPREQNTYADKLAKRKQTKTTSRRNADRPEGQTRLRSDHVCGT